jgi:predicted enzyme related to lactoylglutathione lyase
MTDFSPTSAPVGTPVWVELSGSDLDAAAAFYGAVFGWSRAPYNPETFDFSLGELEVGGLLPKVGDAPDAWNVYLKVDDIRATLAAAAAAGGRVLHEPVREGDDGIWAFLEDPSGAEFGVWQAESFPGFESHGVPGAPCWFELHTKDFDAAVPFYEKVFGCRLTSIGDSDAFRMVVFGQPDTAYAGIYDATHNELTARSQWMTYFAVADADAAASVVQAQGGTVIDGPSDTPFGRMSHAADSTGAAFTFIQLPTDGDLPKDA